MSLLTLYCGLCDRYIEVYSVYSKGLCCSECGGTLTLFDEFTLTIYDGECINVR